MILKRPQRKMKKRETSTERALREEVMELKMEIKALKKFNGLLMEKNELLEKQLMFEQNKQYAQSGSNY